MKKICTGGRYTHSSKKRYNGGCTGNIKDFRIFGCFRIFGYFRNFRADVTLG